MPDTPPHETSLCRQVYDYDGITEIPETPPPSPIPSPNVSPRPSTPPALVSDFGSDDDSISTTSEQSLTEVPPTPPKIVDDSSDESVAYSWVLVKDIYLNFEVGLYDRFQFNDKFMLVPGIERNGTKFVAVKRPMRRTNGAWGRPMIIGFLRDKYNELFHTIHDNVDFEIYLKPMARGLRTEYEANSDVDVQLCFALFPVATYDKEQFITDYLARNGHRFIVYEECPW